MSTKRHFIEVSGIRVEVVRKAIKNLHLAVYPPSGRVRVAVPLHIDDEAVRLAVVSKLSWIHKHQKAFDEQRRQSRREMIDGESHYFQGQRYRLRVIEKESPPQVKVKGNSSLELCVRPDTDVAKREEILSQWYRRELKELIPDIIAEWEPIMGVRVEEWGVKKMKTKWGSCNIRARRIWINLELSKKSAHCLEYIIVHEMNHLLERLHNDRFKALMDQFMPNWRLYRDELNAKPLGHEEWLY